MERTHGRNAKRRIRVRRVGVDKFSEAGVVRVIYPCLTDTPSLPCDEQASIGVGVGTLPNFLRKQVVGKAR